ncbi:MAG: GNAT family N-acetyltransferase [Terriglobales bacterium]
MAAGESAAPWRLRRAETGDIAAIEALIAASVRELSTGEYSPRQREQALLTAFSVDTRLIADGTYFVAAAGSQLAGCGGWSRRKTLCGGDRHAVRDDGWLDPATEAAKIRAIFVHPRWARRGLGNQLLRAAEQAAAAAGFTRAEMGATLTGAPLYRRAGYQDLERLEIPIGAGLTLAVIRMGKTLAAQDA